MAFTDGVFAPLSASANSDAGKVFMYKEDATLAAIRAANYFNAAADTYGLADGDCILIFGSDAFGFSTVSVAAGGNVTVDTSVTSA